MTMYERIVELCNEKGIRPAEMCRETGIQRSIISDLKHGRTNQLSTSTLKKLADFFEVSLGYFEPDDTVDSIKDELFEKRKLLFDMSKKATPQQLEQFLTMFKAVIDENDDQ